MQTGPPKSCSSACVLFARWVLCVLRPETSTITPCCGWWCVDRHWICRRWWVYNSCSYLWYIWGNCWCPCGVWWRWLAGCWSSASAPRRFHLWSYLLYQGFAGSKKIVCSVIILFFHRSLNFSSMHLHILDVFKVMSHGRKDTANLWKSWFYFDSNFTKFSLLQIFL